MVLKASDRPMDTAVAPLDPSDPATEAARVLAVMPESSLASTLRPSPSPFSPAT